jgi:hypothetical protein
MTLRWSAAPQSQPRGALDISAGLWHSWIYTKATMETSKRLAGVQRVQVGCELDTTAPLKILPELPTQMAAIARPE